VTSALSDEAAVLLRHARVARLATIGEGGWPHVVPVCPVLDGDRLVFASDDSGKLRNLRTDPRVAMVADDYVEDWSALRRVLVWGTARVLDDGPGWERGRALLYAKFQQYEPQAEIVAGQTAVVEVSIDRVSVTGV
jgi:PPOX class probable F420-dependent enzyme